MIDLSVIAGFDMVAITSFKSAEEIVSLAEAIKEQMPHVNVCRYYRLSRAENIFHFYDYDDKKVLGVSIKYDNIADEHVMGFCYAEWYRENGYKMFDYCELVAEEEFVAEDISVLFE